MKRFPNLFLVGAPKCGTTSLAYYLGQHPDVFAPLIKEPNYFATDLREKSSSISQADYANLYADWTDQNYALDATQAYLASRTAAESIYATSPDSQILVLVRNPVDAAYSLYNYNRFRLAETLETFEESLEAEADRAASDTPMDYGIVESLLYSRIYAYSDNIMRFQNRFGRDHVHVFLFDDLKQDPSTCFKAVCKALSLDPKRGTPIDFSTRNSAGRSRSSWLTVLTMHPPKWAGKLSSPLLSRPARLKIRTMLGRLNTVPQANPPMNPDTRARLIQKFEPEVQRLSKFLDRDLSDWLTADD